uniref:Uncharacterized protein n=1 Tax=Romanomermis culicivorax TaxID=13658 RepID=A0A915L2L8_ROMCU
MTVKIKSQVAKTNVEISQLRKDVTLRPNVRSMQKTLHAVVFENISDGQQAATLKEVSLLNSFKVCNKDFKKCNEIARDVCNRFLKQWIDCSDKNIIQEIQWRIKE